jgi:hypothetical protein
MGQWEAIQITWPTLVLQGTFFQHMATTTPRPLRLLQKPYTGITSHTRPTNMLYEFSEIICKQKTMEDLERDNPRQARRRHPGGD